jgi:hypothetical protein
MKTDYLVFVGLYFLGMMIRAIYEELKKNSLVSPKNIITFAIVFFGNVLYVGLLVQHVPFRSAPGLLATCC